MAEKRRGRGEDAVYFDHGKTDCRDSRYHRSCTGRWRGEVSLGRDGTGKRMRRKVSGRTKTEVYAKLEELRSELADGIRSSRTYTVQQAVDDWLANGMTDRAPKTISTLGEVLAPLTAQIGKTVLRELTADDVRKALVKIASARSTRTVRERSQRTGPGDHLCPGW